MTEIVQIALIASIAPTIAALAALIVSIQNGKKSDVIIEKATEIHTLTNSNLLRVSAALEVANTKIEGLEKLITAMGKKKK